MTETNLSNLKRFQVRLKATSPEFHEESTESAAYALGNYQCVERAQWKLICANK